MYLSQDPRTPGPARSPRPRTARPGAARGAACLFKPQFPSHYPSLRLLADLAACLPPLRACTDQAKSYGALGLMHTGDGPAVSGCVFEVGTHIWMCTCGVAGPKHSRGLSRLVVQVQGVGGATWLNTGPMNSFLLWVAGNSCFCNAAI